jgi:hypothetical protein
LALSGVFSSSTGLLRLNSRRRERSVTMGDTRLEGGVVGMVWGALRGDGRVRRKCGEGASVGAVVDGCGGEVVDFGTNRGVDSAVRGGVMGREVESERMPGEERCSDGTGYGRRKDVHSVQEHDKFMREREVEAMLFLLSPGVIARTMHTIPCIYYLGCRWNYIVHVWCCERCQDKVFVRQSRVAPKVWALRVDTPIDKGNRSVRREYSNHLCKPLLDIRTLFLLVA